jgi:hypothetical protein
VTANGEVRVPVGADAHRWVTIRGERTILGISRTVTSAVRLLETLDVFNSDTRVQVVFAINETSPFVDGVADVLRAAGARVIPWSQVAKLHADLVLTATENLELDEIAAPVVVLPHGIGFHKYVPDAVAGVRLSGLVPEAALRDRSVTLVASHPDQVEQLERVYPGAGGHALVAGDPTYERLLASGRMRRRYRDALQVRDGQRLVVLTSTWGRQSLWGRSPDLPRRLLAALPSDEYRVALVLHPNVWFGHSQWQVRAWLADARDAGLMLVPPVGGWQSAICAADLVIGDHGSVTLYAATLDKPVLLATFGTEVVPGTVMADLGERIPRIDERGDLRVQLDGAIAAHVPGSSAALAARVFAEPLGATHRLRKALYDRLDLPLPSATPVRTWPSAAPEFTPATSFVGYTDIATPGVVVLRRYPAAVAVHPEVETSALLRHRVSYYHERDQRAIDTASLIIAGPDEGDGRDAGAWAAEVLARHPAAHLAATGSAGAAPEPAEAPPARAPSGTAGAAPEPAEAPLARAPGGTAGGSLVFLRDAGSVLVLHGSPEPEADLLAAVAVAALRRSGQRLRGAVELRVGPRTLHLTLREPPA